MQFMPWQERLKKDQKLKETGKRTHTQAGGKQKKPKVAVKFERVKTDGSKDGV